jgi:hypothetical protein
VRLFSLKTNYDTHLGSGCVAFCLAIAQLVERGIVVEYQLNKTPQVIGSNPVRENAWSIGAVVAHRADNTKVLGSKPRWTIYI